MRCCGSRALFKRYKPDSKNKEHKHTDTHDTDKDSERTQRQRLVQPL